MHALDQVHMLQYLLRKESLALSLHMLQYVQQKESLALALH